MSITPKPNLDTFLKGAKEKTLITTTSTKDKTFLLKMPFEMWKETKEKALQKDMTLHEYILTAIKEKNFSGL